MTTTTGQTLRAAKAEATRREHARVYDNYNLPPRDIVVEHEDGVFVRRAWQSGRHFGWGQWERTSHRRV